MTINTAHHPTPYHGAFPWRAFLFAFVMLGMCSCASPRRGQPWAQADPTRSTRRNSAPLPSPAHSAAAMQQQMLMQQSMMQQQAMQLSQQQINQQQAMRQQGNRQPAWQGDGPVMPVAHHAPLAVPAGPGQVNSNWHPEPCTAPYCLSHGQAGPGHPAHGQQNDYLPGPDAPNLGRWRDDEFLCDGGDQDVEVVIGADWSVYGLNLEDTVGHYDTLDGRRIVEPSNKVCIYAPRFAAVRQVRGVISKRQRVKSAGVEIPEQLVQADDLQIASTKLQQIQPLGELGREGPVTFEEQTRGLTVDNTLGPDEFANRFGVHENFQVIRMGIHQNSEEAFLAQSIEAAVVWETKQAVQVIVDEKQVHIQKGLAAAQSLNRIEERGQPKMRIIKVASTKLAQPGDVVEFTIRFDNIGTEKMGNVTIIDNLTTRLEYVPDSAQCNIKADFLTQENEAESLILRWEIVDPLEAGQGGIIRFKCRVR